MCHICRSFKVSSIVTITGVLCLALVAVKVMQPEPADPAKEPGDVPPYKRMLSGDDAKRVAELEAKVKRLGESGQFAEAQAPAGEIVQIRTRVQGSDHWETADARRTAETLKLIAAESEDARRQMASLDKIQAEANQWMQRGSYAQAEPVLQKVLAICRKVLSDEHPVTATSYNNLAFNLKAQGKYAQAETLYQKALAIHRRVLGEGHPHTAAGYNNLAGNLVDRGKYAEAEPLYQKALAIRRKVLGEDHPDTAQSYNNLAWYLDDQGKYAEAEPLHQKALAIRRKVLGQEHPDTATSYNNLAFNLNAQGKYAEAEPLHQKGLAVRRKVLGQEHPDTATSYNNLALNLNAQGRYAEAEPLFQTGLAIRRKVLGEEHPDTAVSYHNLAGNQKEQGKYVEAEPLFQNALAIWRKVLGDEHAHTAVGYGSLALNLDAQGKHAEAEPLYQKALAIKRKVLGEEHPGTAQSYNNTVVNLDAQGKYAEAEPLYQKALAIKRKALGEEHPDTAAGYYNVAGNLYAQGKYAEAEQKWITAAERFAKARLQIAFAGLDRAGVSAERSPLQPLAAILARNGKPAEAWRRLEENLGRGLFDDLSARQARHLSAEERKHQQELTAKLQRLDKLFANLPPAKDKSPERQKQLDDLSRQYSQTQAELSQFEADLVRKHGVAAGEVYDLAKIQAQLPADAALIAWLDIKGKPHAADPNGEHWACIVRKQGTPAWVKLPGSGPKEAWTKEDDELPSRVAASFSKRPSENNDWRKSAVQLNRQRFAPVAKLLAGNGKVPPVKRLIVLPSPSIANVPVETLLSDKDDYTISYAPSGTMFVWLTGKPTNKSQEQLSLLALADPAFAAPKPKPATPPPDHGVLITAVQPDSAAAKAGLRSGDVLLSYAGNKLTKSADLSQAIQQAGDEQKKTAGKDLPLQVWRDGQTLDLAVPPGKLGVVPDKRAAAEAIRAEREFASLMRATRGPDFSPLPGTRREVDAIAQTFHTRDAHASVTLLQGSGASEQELEALVADGQLARYRYLHLATHGVADNRRALQSALILAQDRLPDPVEQSVAGKPVYDGRLTAEQILRTWNLNADLVTLSACVSALGKQGGGEGYLGFAQALFLAGARSVVLSLWKVDDAATALLMTRFYQNLLGARKDLAKPLPKAQALQEAKHWLRHLTAQEVEQRLTELPRGTVVERRSASSPAQARPYEHPYYWAAFILIGDPD